MTTSETMTTALTHLTLGARIRQARKGVDMTADDLARALGVKTQTVFRWEWDKHEPSVKKLRAIAEITGVPLASLLRSDGAAA